MGMRDEMNLGALHLAGLPLPAKIMLTLFLLLVGVGYLVALGNIYYRHRDADLEPGLSLNDLSRAYHGLNKEVHVAPGTAAAGSPMLQAVSPGGEMRSHLENGGEPAIRTLVSWLRGGAREADFSRPGLDQPGDPSPQQVIAAQCIRCHNADGGEKEDLPYAASASAEPQYSLVAKVAQPPASPAQVTWLAPTDRARLIHITHGHILSIPVFTLIVGGLFLLTGLNRHLKLIIGPLPMLAVCVDISSWWLARPFEPFIYLIAAAGAVFGATYGFQILCVFGALWFGRRPQQERIPT